MSNTKTEFFTLKPMPTGPHASIQAECTMSLKRQGAIAVPELMVRVSTSPVRFLVPDIAVVREIPETYAVEPAILCIKILSPGQDLGEILAKCEKYHAWGVPCCWVIDAENRTGWEHHAGGEPRKSTAPASCGPTIRPAG